MFQNPYVELEHSTRRCPEDAPYLELWGAVVQQALLDLDNRLSGRDRSSGTQKSRAENRRLALEWILNASDASVGSFRWVCGQLGIDAGAAQQRILHDDQERTAGEKERVSAPAAPPVLKLVPPPAATVCEIKPKARKTMANNGNGHYNLEALREAARHFGDELAQAEAIVSRLKPVVAHLNGAVDALEGQKPHQQPRPMVIPAKTPGRARQVFPPVPKRPPYEKTALIEALRAELKKATEPMHYDELTRAIFDGEGEQLWRAKQSVTSTLSHCAKKGYWTRLADGRYTLGAGEGIEPGLAAAR